jgi:hypothetical protein
MWQYLRAGHQSSAYCFEVDPDIRLDLMNIIEHFAHVVCILNSGPSIFVFTETSSVEAFYEDKKKFLYAINEVSNVYGE